MTEVKNIISYKAPLYEKLRKKDEIETECLFGEKFSIIKSIFKIKSKMNIYFRFRSNQK